jgi:protease PrsW
VRSDPLFALSLAVVVAVVYLVVLRLVDLNEREPLWALVLALGLGAVAAAIAAAVVDPGFRVLDTFGEAFTAEAGKLVALVLAVGALEGISRLRGWSELNGPVDGLVYGAAVGLGWAVGETFHRELLVEGASAIDATASTFTLVWTAALGGLSHGLFGAIIGAGFGVALSARHAVTRLLAPLVAFGAALLAHLGYELLATGDSLSGSFGRTLASALLPLALVAALMVFGLLRERRAIADELADEAAGGVVSAEDLERLRSPGARRAFALSRLAKGDLDGWLSARALHNRQVQLALTERRARAEQDAGRRAGLDAEAGHLRRSILELKARLDGGATPGRGAAV